VSLVTCVLTRGGWLFCLLCYAARPSCYYVWVRLVLSFIVFMNINICVIHVQSVFTHFMTLCPLYSHTLVQYLIYDWNILIYYYYFWLPVVAKIDIRNTYRPYRSKHVVNNFSKFYERHAARETVKPSEFINGTQQVNVSLTRAVPKELWIFKHYTILYTSFMIKFLRKRQCFKTNSLWMLPASFNWNNVK
jgi:hypothetical protein